MSGTPQGAAKAQATLIKKYGSLEAYREHQRSIGSAGGKAGVGTAKGFAASHELAVRAGAKGGRISRRKKKDVQKEV